MMMRYLYLACSALGLAIASAAPAQDRAQRVEWNRPMAPFRIAPDVY